MKDFDQERRERNAEREREMGERAFQLGGETFTYRGVVSYTVLERVAGTSDLDGADLIQSLEQAVVDMLEDGQEERFLKVVRSTSDPLTFADLNQLCTWLTEAQVRRPTLVPSPSTPGAGSTSTSSKADLSTEQVAASAASPSGSS